MSIQRRCAQITVAAYSPVSRTSQRVYSAVRLTTGVINEEARNRRRPVLQHSDEAVLGNVFRDLLFICEPKTG
ncbi:hypothetical protein X755_05860 [Mesorhizobium sp. LNJC405B00]|nr:hypothetical protein X756_32160 [Mesorhizobium sp. LSHC412B00]ESY01457.1 hypothetical protein X755_05860 [Mesorhizobium sp. LNJC405B00]